MIFAVYQWKKHFKYDDDLVPPNERIFCGQADTDNFKEHGQVYVERFIRHCHLKPNEKILEVGCGIGRIAIPLAQYLKTGSYEGFDIVPHGIEWCQQKVATRYSNFNFQLADIYNKAYNPNGKFSASEYRFPYQNESFDFIFLTSIFTHMLPNDVENYLSEIERVLKKGGRCFITFFLWNEKTGKLVTHQKRKNKLTFQNDFGQYHLQDRSTPEIAIAYEEKFVKESYKKYNLSYY
ncbi:class I SAM-dependent methyltransferase [Candidatus Parabeggiatoa sp. HSG14]|uniref:class I SAM-dependent methyltransferase n=1 Tax=Candidatus Parabeggiatoa sp. HSG14 TaxID=3055593 RepID=UPI0025A6C541|nr:class I SAM-dependent methyltransferase [Thiotrichales bacterium HSG14]